jgi:hypothetical protein
VSDETLFAYIGSAGLESGLESDLQQMVSSAFRGDSGTKEVRVSLGDVHGVGMKYQIESRQKDERER